VRYDSCLIMSAQETTPKPQPADLYKADYIGSGTFIIKKPKRNGRKTHQTRVKNRRGGRI
jgi:hypothetical protein